MSKIKIWVELVRGDCIADGCMANELDGRRKRAEAERDALRERIAALEEGKE